MVKYYKELLKTIFHIIILLLIFFSVMFFVDIPYKQKALLSVFLCTLFLWILEILPLGIVSIFSTIMCYILRISSEKVILAPFADPIIFLFLGSFIISDAFFKSGLSENIAKSILKFSGIKLIILLVALPWFLSYWFSNTAVTIMVLPIISSVSANFGEKARKIIYLNTAYAASAGGMATLIGTPPNLIALGFLRNQNINLTFVDWMKIGLPASAIVFLAILTVVLINLRSEKITVSPKDLKVELTSEHKKILLVSLLVVAMWLAPAFFKIFGATFPISESMAALIGAFLLFALGIQDISSFGRIDWNTIFLFGGGLAMGNLFFETELSKTVGSLISSMLPQSRGICLLIIIAAMVFLTDLISNTACAASFIPIIISFCVERNFPLTTFVLAVAFGSSCAFMFPISTPPNAIVYSAGNLKIKFMIKYGFIMDIVSILAIYIVLIFRMR